MITRFAPSPTGPLHLGHAYSAMLAYDMAMAAGGTFLLRVEDIDQSRARSEWEEQIYEDLAWLGLSWPTPVRRQSDHLPTYAAALDQLWNDGLLFPCHCTRRDIHTAASAPQEGVSMGSDGIIYPGTCKHLARPDKRPTDSALRLDMTQAAQQISYVEQGKTQSLPAGFLTESIGDVVLARKDMGSSYHLSVVIDDAAQNISHVIRGNDLAEATPIHIILQKILNLPTPAYHHHRLIRDQNGKRLAKRDDARAISKYRAEGATPNDIRQMLGLPAV
jgi:glutamyl-Q tRNA(Asp) synthetase